MTEKDIVKFNAMEIASIFHIMYFLEKPSIDEGFALIYNSEFYQLLVNDDDNMFAFAPYWAYAWIMEEEGEKPKSPTDNYKSDIPYSSMLCVAGEFEQIRLAHKDADPGYLAELLVTQGFFEKMINNSSLREEAKKFIEKVVKKRSC